ncbi:conserved hypothetical protein [Parafrankia sp. Ea1.12]|nr:conserved hypothetical protein [Parafrankia sp. Ea1.12]
MLFELAGEWGHGRHGMNISLLARRMVPGDVWLGHERVMVPARSFWRRVWERRGIDITASMAAAPCLVVAPHPDDETLGCAVAIMRKRAAGTPVTVVLVSDGARGGSAAGPPAQRLVERHSPAELAEMRRTEARRACARLGVAETDVIFLGFPDSELPGCVDSIAARLGEVISARSPAQILAPASCEGHPDHDATHEAVRRAVRAGGFDGEILEYTVWLWTHWPWTLGHGTGHWSARRLLLAPVQRVHERRPLLVDARGLRERQKHALAAHVTQVGPGAEGDQRPGTGAPLTGSLLATLESRYEVYVAADGLRHLDFDRPWRAGGARGTGRPHSPPPGRGSGRGPSPGPVPSRVPTPGPGPAAPHGPATDRDPGSGSGSGDGSGR